MFGLSTEAWPSSVPPNDERMSAQRHAIKHKEKTMHREKSIEEIGREQIKCVEILYRSFDAQLEDFQSTLQRLSSALAPCSDSLPEHASQYICARLRDDLERWKRKYGIKIGNPDQPRGPDGCWISDGGSNNSQEVSKPAVECSTSDRGIDFIRRREGFRPQVYRDEGGKLTIGYGHLLQRSEKYPNGISRDEALKLLSKDVQTTETAIKRNVEVNLTRHQFDALTSLVFNIGGDKFEESTLLRRLNKGDYNGAANQFPAWNKVTVDGVKVPSVGLTNRRKMERNLFLYGKYE